jgi:hypothetical protein
MAPMYSMHFVDVDISRCTCALQSVLDYAGLDLRSFYAGALVRFQGGWHRVADPFR